MRNREPRPTITRIQLSKRRQEEGQLRAYVSLRKCSVSPSTCTVCLLVSSRAVRGRWWVRKAGSGSLGFGGADKDGMRPGAAADKTHHTAILVQFEEDDTGENKLKTFSNMSTTSGATAFLEEGTRLQYEETRTKRSIGCFQS